MKMFLHPAINGGKRVRDFEDLLKDFLKVKHVITVNSGTSALHASILAAEGIKQGDDHYFRLLRLSLPLMQ